MNTYLYKRIIHSFKVQNHILSFSLSPSQITNQTDELRHWLAFEPVHLMHP